MARTDLGEDDGDQRRLALRVDGDNAQPKMAERIMSEVSRFGNPVVRGLVHWRHASQDDCAAARSPSDPIGTLLI